MIVSLKTARDKQAVGKKAVALSLLCEKYPVPAGFVITADTFSRFVELHGIDKKTRELLADVSEDKFPEISSTLQKMIIGAVLPEAVIEELHDAYYALNIEETHSLQQIMNTTHDPVVVVRPSPLHDEKGLHANFLGIQGVENLKKAILECWASFYSEDAIANNAVKQQQFAVIVQKMIQSNASGVLHTSYQMNTDEVLILGCKGLGSVLSTGLVVPDKYFITKNSLNIASIELGKQPFMIEHDAGKITKVYLQEEYAKKQKVSDRHIGELTLYSREIEELFGKPMEIDFAIQKDAIYFVNAVEAQWLRQKQEPAPMPKKLEEMSVEEIQKKEDEISHHITEELEKDLLIAKAAEQQNITHQEKFIPLANPDPNDINSLVLSVDFDQLLKETPVEAAITQKSSYVLHAQKNEASIFTEKIAESQEEIEIKEAAKNTKPLTAFQKSAGELVIHCFKEIKAALPQEKWSGSPELRHLAVLAQNYSQKNVAPSPAQVKFAMDAVEKVKK